MLKVWKYAALSLVVILPVRAETTSKTLEDVIAEVNPSVVSIAAETEDAEALGAGIIVGADGYVVTNAHVTENADRITVITADDTEYEAKLVGSDTKTDIALIKVLHPNGFEPAEFADSDTVRVGNAVFAIGNPFGLGNSVSLGIISAKERDIEKGPYDNFLQTDASINQGNSGGPLFNMNGEIVGMNTAIFSTDGVNMGVGFATPSNQVAWVVSQLKQNGKVVRGWLGIGVQKFQSTETDKKLIISAMAEHSPAADAGLKVGDILETVGEMPLNNPRLFSLGISKLKPGTTLPMTVLRDKETLNVEVTISEMPTEEKSADKSETKNTEKLSEDEQIRSLERLGLDKYKVQNAVDFPQLHFKAYFDEADRYFTITQVEKNSEAAHKGIEVGNRFGVVNGKKVFGVEDLKIKIKEAEPAGKIEIQIAGAASIDTIILNLEP